MRQNNDIILTDNERQECEIWTRVMGYYRPVSMFNDGKKEEFFERVYYSEEKTCCNKKEQVSLP